MAIAKKILGKAIKKTRQEFGKPKVKKPNIINELYKSLKEKHCKKINWE